MWPAHFDPASIDLIDKLLAYSPQDRLGLLNIEELKSHPFFEGIDF